MSATVFRPTPAVWKICYNGFSNGIAKTSVWSPLVNTGFPFTTFWKMIVRSSLPIPNMLRLSVERKLTRRVPNGLLTCLSAGSCCRKLHAACWHPPASWPYALPFQTDLLSIKRKESFAELSHGFQYPVGKRCVGHPYGKSAQAILNKVLENPEDTSFDLEPFVYRSLKKKLPELRDAIDGYITPEQAGKLKVIKAHYESLESRKAELEELILALAAPYQQELAILQTAPGISSGFTAIGIISEIGTNMEAFPSAKHLCSWAGLTPTNNESAGKKKSVRVSKAGCYQTAFGTTCQRWCQKQKAPWNS